MKNIYIKKEMESLTNTMIYVPRKRRIKIGKNRLLLSINGRRYKALYRLSYDLLFILTTIIWYVSINILSNWFIYFYYFGLSSFPCREKIHFKFHVRLSIYYGIMYTLKVVESYFVQRLARYSPREYRKIWRKRKKKKKNEWYGTRILNDNFPR